LDPWLWMNNLVVTYGYLGAFIVCIIGNVSIFLPIPFALIIYLFGSTLNPLVLGIVSGVGSAIGEMVSYIIGRGGRKVIESRYGKRLDAVEKLIDRYGILVVFLAALTPVPDDILLIPLGMIKYPAYKTFTAMVFGKTIMCLILAYAGAFSFTGIKNLYESGSFITEIVSLSLLIMIIVALVKIDWTKIVDDHLEKTSNKNQT